MRILIRGIKRVINDFNCDDPRAVFFIWVANAIPDLYILKIVKTACLKVAGVQTGMDSIYFKSRIMIDTPSALKIGSRVFINRNVMFEGTGRIVISGNCQIGPNVVFATTSHDIENAMATSVGSIRVEENVWVGAGVIVLKDVQLGPNVVVAAGSVVNKSFSNCVIAGSPARCIKQLEGRSPPDQS